MGESLLGAQAASTTEGQHTADVLPRGLCNPPQKCHGNENLEDAWMPSQAEAPCVFSPPLRTVSGDLKEGLCAALGAAVGQWWCHVRLGGDDPVYSSYPRA